MEALNSSSVCSQYSFVQFWKMADIKLIPIMTDESQENFMFWSIESFFLFFLRLQYIALNTSWDEGA